MGFLASAEDSQKCMCDHHTDLSFTFLPFFRLRSALDCVLSITASALSSPLACRNFWALVSCFALGFFLMIPEP